MPSHQIQDPGQDACFEEADVHQISNVGISSKDHILFSWKMNGKTIDGWPFHVHGKLKDVVACLDRGDVSCIQIRMNFISPLLLHGSSVWTLVDVLVDILDCLHKSTNFQIDATIELDQRLSEMGNHMAVVKGILILLDGPVVFRTSIVWITILLDDGLSNKGLGKVLFANIVFYIPLENARTMKHIFEDSLMRLGMDSRIRNLG